jgi:GTP-binding protein LepA
LLELTGTIVKDGKNKQVLDKLNVERERGITVKAQTASMIYKHSDGKKYLLNLIDTPGHVDFSYEVSRSLAACEGCILLVDAAQGVQAQTVANHHLAHAAGLTIIPILNKVDLPGAEVERVSEQMQTVFDMSDSFLQISAKSGLGIDQVLPMVIDRIPPPRTSSTHALRALLFDSWYDLYRGVVCLVAIKDGQILRGDRLLALSSDLKYEVLDVGVMFPDPISTDGLFAGQVGYVILGMKTASEARVGDTFCRVGQLCEPLAGFKPAQSMLFAGVYPVDSNEFPKLSDAISRLTLNDSSVSVNKETSNALGQGFRLGFLGSLHMDVFSQRLEEEYNANVILTNPSVPLQILWKDGRVTVCDTPLQFPTTDEWHKVDSVQEPMVKATLIFPSEYLGSLMELCGEHRGVQLDYRFLDDKRIIMTYLLPLSEIMTDFYDQLKSKTSGYATFDYEDAGYEDADLVKLQILLNGKPVDVLSTVLHRCQMDKEGKALCKRLKKVIDKQLYEIVIQACVDNKILARESIQAMRKNVLAKCYGGDVSRKMKLLAKQKEGKKRMKRVGNVELSQEAFFTLIRKGD